MEDLQGSRVGGERDRLFDWSRLILVRFIIKVCLGLGLCLGQGCWLG